MKSDWLSVEEDFHLLCDRINEETWIQTDSSYCLANADMRNEFSAVRKLHDIDLEYNDGDRAMCL